MQDDALKELHILSPLEAAHGFGAVFRLCYNKWLSMPLTLSYEPLGRSSQPARFVVLDDLRLQVDRVEHRSLAG